MSPPQHALNPPPTEAVDGIVRDGLRGYLQARLRLIEHGAHVAHRGPLRPVEVWRARGGVRGDGSNFFDVAERVF